MLLLNVLQPHPEDRLHLRLHRARSVVLTAQEYVPLSVVSQCIHSSNPIVSTEYLRSIAQLRTNTPSSQARRNPRCATNLRRSLHPHCTGPILLRPRSPQDLHGGILLHWCPIRNLRCRHTIGEHV